MAKPARAPIHIPNSTYFIGTSTGEKRRLFQSEQLAVLLIGTLEEYRRQHKFLLHSFVLMPDHLHLLITPALDLTIERVMQLVKGGYSFRVKKELGKNLEVWQRGFTDRQVRDVHEYRAFTEYIEQNPVKAKLVASAEEYAFSSANRAFQPDPPPEYLRG